MKPIEDYLSINKCLSEEGIEEQLEWILLDDIKSYELFTEFFKDEMLTSSHEVMHIVDRS